MSSLTAERLRVTVLSAALDDEVRMSFSSLRSRRTCIVEVEAGGLVGVGESWINYPDWGYRERVATLCEGIAPHLLGTDVSDPVAVQERLTAATLSIGRQWGALGPIWQAVSGVDLALWDLRGKAEGKPVAALLAPAPARTSAPAYASGIGPDRVDHWCKIALADGFAAAKVKLGFGAERDRATLRTASAVLGADVGLLADVNQGWTVDEACEMAPDLRAHQVRWLEEPIAGNRLEDLEELADRTGLPLATGENTYGLAQLLRYTASPAVGTIQPDLAKCGGITIASRVAARAAETGTALAPHCYGSAVGIAASLHLAAAFPDVGPVELDVRDNPFRTELISPALRLDGGRLDIPTGPGLGFDLDRDTVTRYRIHQEERTRHDL
ncbi:mandelate racemase/muconate lactonizing enzyme family protein [Actinomadura chibensis]|uniref:mandelate racemase/muconate lactonizing enzyme family protein n=1 Tax=Actinomadura chibensis TaxID=392828 RepID=UPI000ABD6072|nr:mandelate racemase/muconate lactonizing enzyme family protein [Actinomadura chibensis]